MDKGLLIAGGLLAFALLKSRKISEPSAVVQNQSGIWFDARLTEYHPDAPPDKQKLEGGPNDRKKQPVVTVQEHLRDKAKFPYVSVAGDLVLNGERVKYGTRIYFSSYPDIVFRIVDTGGNFFGTGKKIREPGFEPFDIATSYGSKLGFSGKHTKYRLDRSDTLISSSPVRVA